MPLTPEALEERLSRPLDADVAFMRRHPGDILILGAAGKMGPSLARLARRAADAAGSARRVIAVARGFAPEAARPFAACNVETLACDLLDPAQLDHLPDCPNVLFLAGRKFGSTGNEPLTWATNVLLPARVAERFAHARIVGLSSGNVYPLSPHPLSEQAATAPVGEYAQSVLGRERVFAFYSASHGTPVTLVRLNYAIDVRYGVLLDIGQRVWQRLPVNLAMGRVNVIWQGDACSMCLRALEHASSPPLVLNVTGHGVLHVRWVAECFGDVFGIPPLFEGVESATALLSDASLACRLLGPPATAPEEMIALIADWIRDARPTWNKPTHFEVRDGRF
jgi:nucleoside-diphosphate-sugar epimerase